MYFFPRTLEYFPSKVSKRPLLRYNVTCLLSLSLGESLEPRWSLVIVQPCDTSQAHKTINKITALPLLTLVYINENRTREHIEVKI